MIRLRHFLLYITLGTALCLVGLTERIKVQADEKAPFTLLTVKFKVYDKWGRPFLVPHGTARLRVTLADEDDQMADLSPYDYLEANEVKYKVTAPDNEDATGDEGDENYGQVFSLDDRGQVQVQLVVFSDESKNPVTYKFTLEQLVDGKWQEVPLLNSLYAAGEATGNKLTSSQRAPNRTWEWLVIIGFYIIAAMVTYIWFGRVLFARMLFNRSMEVNSAVLISNLLVILGLLCQTAVVILLYLFPYVIWHKVYWIYVVTIVGYFLLLSLSYALGMLMTKG